MLPIAFNPELHELTPCEFERHLQRELKDDDLFVYHHKRTGKYVVAVWMNSRMAKLPGSAVLELVILGDTPTGHKRFVDAIRLMKRGNSKGEKNLEENKRQLRNFDKAWIDDMIAAQAQEMDLKRFIKGHVSQQRHNDPFFIGVKGSPQSVSMTGAQEKRDAASSGRK